MRVCLPRAALMHFFYPRFVESALLPLGEYWVSVQQRTHTSMEKVCLEVVMSLHQAKESPEERPQINLPL